MNKSLNYQNTVIIVGKFKGLGGVESVHNNLYNTYKKMGFDVLKISSLNSFISLFFRVNSEVKIVYFSGLSIFFSPLFLSCKKHVFFVHGFYVHEQDTINIKRYLKKYFYEFITSFCLIFYRWVVCIAPSPVSSLINSFKYSRNVKVVQWGVSDEYLNYPLNNNKYKYHLSFLGRPNSQKLNISSIDLIIEKFIDSKIVFSAEDLNIAFLMPQDNKYSLSLINKVHEKYRCSINKFINLSNHEICSILSKTLYYFNCYEWEAFGITNIEALCMGCNIIIPSTSPIIPMVDNLKGSPIYKYNPPSILNKNIFRNRFTLNIDRQNSETVKYFRSIFNWEIVIKEIHEIVNF